MSEHLRYGEDEAQAPVSAPLYPVKRIYPLATVDASAGGGEVPSETDWARAFEAGTFLANGRPEPADRCTTFRLLRRGDRLFLSVRLPSSAGPTGGEAVELAVASSAEPGFPCLLVKVGAAGTLSAGSVPRPHTVWTRTPLDPVPDGSVRHRVVSGPDGVRVEIALALGPLGISPDGFHFNVVRRTPDGQTFAWCDLFGGPIDQPEVLGRAVAVRDHAPYANGFALPADVAVGVNRLRLERPDPSLSVRVGGRPVTAGSDGTFALPVADRGPLDVELVRRDGTVVGAYHAGVPRPLLVAAHEPFLPAGAAEFTVDVTLNVAGDDAVPVTVTCRREGGADVKHSLRLAPGRHAVTLPVPAGSGTEVALEAVASLAGPPSVTLAARHWFCVGVEAETLDRYSDGIRDLPADRLYWALLADAVRLRRLRQAGSGAYGRTDRSQGAMWEQSFVYAVALLYRTESPENPFAGDQRLLDSAVLGMEFALRPTLSVAEYLEPDNRSLQAYLLAYELLRDAAPPACRDYWAYELKHRADAAVRRWLRPLDGTTAVFSVDCGTGTNHMVYHVANVHLAGVIFERRDWQDLGRRLMRRIARNGLEGNFEERQGVPVNHYTWLSANGLGEYRERSGDAEVDATLEAVARYETAITTAHGEVMALHDGRNSHHGSYATGQFVLSRTPEGRAAARAILLRIMGDRPSKVGLEGLWRCAESAAYFHPGPEADFTADAELPFSHGVIARRSGFHYALSTIGLGPVNKRFRLDPQNAVELFHRDAGCILHGGNSMLQPEAGTFCRALPEAPVCEGLAAVTAPRMDYLPITASVARLPDGHDLTLNYWSFSARLAVHVLSPRRLRLVVTPHIDSGDEPAVFNFFPAVKEGEAMAVEGRTLRFGSVRIETSREAAVERDFRIMNPYLITFTYTHKPVRCWVALNSDETFVLDIAVD